MSALLGGLWSDVFRCALLATPALALVAIACLIARSAGPALRHRAWLFALIGTGAAPLFATLVSPASIALPDSLESLTTVIEIGATGESRANEAGSVSATSSEHEPSAAETSSFAVSGVLPWLWATGTLFLLAELSLGLVGLRRLRRRAVPHEGAHEEQVGELRGDVSSPITFGWRTPTILLPHCASTWSERRLRAVRLHERAHVDRADWLCWIIARTVRCIFWFHPLVWYATLQLKHEAEQACDQEVLREGVQPTDYASELLELAKSVRGTHAAGVAMARRSRLGQRIRSILGNRESAPGVLRRWAVSSIALAIVAPAAVLQPVTPTSPEPPVRIVQARWGGGGWTAGVFVRGIASIAETGDEVDDVKLGGYFVLLTRNDRTGIARRYSVVRRRTGIERTYTVDGEPQRFDARAVDWLRTLIAQARHRLRGEETPTLVGGASPPLPADLELWGSTMRGPRALTRDGGGTTVLGRLPSDHESTRSDDSLLFFKVGTLRWTDGALAGLSPDAWFVVCVEPSTDPAAGLSIHEYRPPDGRSHPAPDSQRTALARLAEVEWLHAP